MKWKGTGVVKPTYFQPFQLIYDDEDDENADDNGVFFRLPFSSYDTVLKILIFFILKVRVQNEMFSFSAYILN